MYVQYVNLNWRGGWKDCPQRGGFPHFPYLEKKLYTIHEHNYTYMYMYVHYRENIVVISKALHCY